MLFAGPLTEFVGVAGLILVDSARCSTVVLYVGVDALRGFVDVIVVLLRGFVDVNVVDCVLICCSQLFLSRLGVLGTATASAGHGVP